MGFSKELYHEDGLTNSGLSPKSRTKARMTGSKLPRQSGVRQGRASEKRHKPIVLEGYFERLRSASIYQIELLRRQVFDRKNMLKVAIVAALYLIVVRPPSTKPDVFEDQNSSFALNVAETIPPSNMTPAKDLVLEDLMPEPMRIADPVVSAAKKTESTVLYEKKVANKPQISKNANPHAPVSHKSLMADEVKTYIERFAPIAVAEMKKFGVPASISLAQGLVESRAGTSKLAVGNNNHFGIKCFSKNCSKGHCTNHTDDTHKDFFRKYNTAWESWRAHSVMISSGRYAKLKKNGKDYKKWANGLQEVGYATDKGYARKIIEIIERYNLQKYDQ